MSHYPYGSNVDDFKPGDRVEVHPASGYFLAGYHYGTVEELGKRTVTVELNQLGRTITVSMHPNNLKVVTD